MNSIQGIRYIVNASPDHGKGPAFLSPAETAAVQAFHEALPEYAPTALVPLPELAEILGIKAAFIKDESTRFGLKAFKGLGGSYAVFRAVCERLGLDYRKTSGNHAAREGISGQAGEGASTRSRAARCRRTRSSTMCAFPAACSNRSRFLAFNCVCLALTGAVLS